MRLAQRGMCNGLLVLDSGKIPFAVAMYSMGEDFGIAEGGALFSEETVLHDSRTHRISPASHGGLALSMHPLTMRRVTVFLPHNNAKTIGAEKMIGFSAMRLPFLLLLNQPP